MLQILIIDDEQKYTTLFKNNSSGRRVHSNLHGNSQ